MYVFLKLFLISIPIFVVCDLLWLGVIARDFYQTRLQHLLGDVVWPAAVVFYIVFLLGLTYFVTYPLIEAKIERVALTGFIFGLVTYATYDLTNHATLKSWPLSVTVVDMLWGACLGALVSVGVAFVYQALH
jgi:uncharacterized membrane protein